jgi:hypothetical protein
MGRLQLVGCYVELSHMKYPNRFIRLRCNFSLISRQAPLYSGRSKTDPGMHTRIPCSDLSRAGDRCVYWLFLVQHSGNLRPVQHRKGIPTSALCQPGIPFLSMIPSATNHPQKTTEEDTCPLGKLFVFWSWLIRTSRGWGRGRLTTDWSPILTSVQVQEIPIVTIASNRRRLLHKTAAVGTTRTFTRTAEPVIVLKPAPVQQKRREVTKAPRVVSPARAA